MTERPLILITNDDGWEAPGLAALRQHLEPLGEILAVAPLGEQSAIGHGVTVFEPMPHRHLMRQEGHSEIHALHAKPADCVKFGVLHLASRRPGLVVSGINPGSNVGNNVLYSGTVAAAREAAMLGIPALAVSLNCRIRDEVNPRFDTAGAWAARLAAYVLEKSLPQGTMLNVNVPNLPPESVTEGTPCRQGRLMFIDAFHPVEPNVYANRGTETVRAGELGEKVDDAVVRAGQVAVTPMHFDLTHEGLLESLPHFSREETGYSHSQK